MPQLAPMNWIFLVVLFWFTVFCLGICIWWVKDSNYKFFDDLEHKTSSIKKWTW